MSENPIPANVSQPLASQPEAPPPSTTPPGGASSTDKKESDLEARKRELEVEKLDLDVRQQKSWWHDHWDKIIVEVVRGLFLLGIALWIQSRFEDTRADRRTAEERLSIVIEIEARSLIEVANPALLLADIGVQYAQSRTDSYMHAWNSRGPPKIEQPRVKDSFASEAARLSAREGESLAILDPAIARVKECLKTSYYVLDKYNLREPFNELVENAEKCKTDPDSEIILGAKPIEPAVFSDLKEKIKNALNAALTQAIPDRAEADKYPPL